MSLDRSQGAQTGEHNTQHYYFGVAGLSAAGEALLQHVGDLASC